MLSIKAQKKKNPLPSLPIVKSFTIVLQYHPKYKMEL